MRHRAAAIAVLLAALAFPAGAQLLDWSGKDPASSEAFRLGVQSFQRGFFNEAILSLEKAISLAPSDPLLLSWLARSYFRSGLESTSIDRWKEASSAGDSPFLQSRIEFISSRRAAADGEPPAERMIGIGTILSASGKKTVFMRPTWICPDADGSMWVVAYGSNSILRYNANGILDQRKVGPLGGFDRPYAMIPKAGGGYYLSEQNSDRIAVLSGDGSTKARFGGHGSGDGQLLGPGALATDDLGYLYVCDFGNRRVEKFSPDGSFVQAFGASDGSYPGLFGPTGIAFSGDSLFVLDRTRASLFEFDRDGNYQRTLADKGRGLSSPEGLSLGSGGRLLVTDGDRVLSVDPETEDVVTIYRSQEKGARYAYAVPDANGDLAICNFATSNVEMACASSLVYSGLFVNVMRANADRFPLVELEVSVQDSRGLPITGLDRRNFYLSERVRRQETRTEGANKVQYLIDSLQPPPSVDLLGEGDPDGRMDSVFLFDGSPGLRPALPAAKESLLLAMAKASTEGKLSYVYGGKVPQAADSLSPAEAYSRCLRAPGTPGWRFDTALRLAASGLAAAGSRRTVFFVTAGGVTDTPFKSYSLSDLAAYLNNNAVKFVALVASEGTNDPALDYLARQTGGAVYSVNRPEGLVAVMDDFASRRTGIYRLRFSSAADSEFGRKYLPFSLEVYCMKKSGRDEFGYFAPFQ